MVSNEFGEAMWLMRCRDPQMAEDGFARLRVVVAEHVGELIDEYRRETEHGVWCWLLELIGLTRSAEAFDLLAAELGAGDESLTGWAMRGLELMDSKQARRLLWQWRQGGAFGVVPADGL